MSAAAVLSVLAQVGQELTSSLTQESRLLVSAVAILGFLALALLVYLLGDALKSIVHDEGVVEAFQSSVVTGLGLVLAATLVVVWDLREDLGDAFAAVTFDGETAVLVMVSMLVFGGAYTGTRVTKRLIKRESDRNTITAHQKEIAHHVVQIMVFVPAVLFVMALWGARPDDLLLGAGALGIVVGLAARQTLGSVLAGFVLLFARPFEIGDWVLIGDNEGTVTDVSIFNTEIRTFDNEHVLIPNEEVTSEEITNRSRSRQLRITVDVGVDYDADVRQAAAVGEEAMEGCSEVLDTPRPDVVLNEFGASSVVLTCRFWIDEPNIQHKWRAQNAVIEAVKAAFEREGIDIPFPQRTLSGRAEAEALVTPVREVSDGERGDGDGSDGSGESTDDEASQEEAQ